MRTPIAVTRSPMVGRLIAPYSTELEPDIVLTEPQPRHRTPPAWMILCTLGGSIVALSGSILFVGIDQLSSSVASQTS